MYEIEIDGLLLTVDQKTYNELQDEEYAQAYIAAVKNAMLEKTEGRRQEAKSSLWTSSKKQTQEDHEATLLLLKLRKDLNDKFNDKKTCKNNLWTRIADELNRNNFFVGDGINGREKVRQKFANLQKKFIKTSDRRRQTGEGKVENPPYFDQLYEILGGEDKANPILLIDSASKSVNDTNTEDSVQEKKAREVSDVASSSSESSTHNRFTAVASKIKPKSARTAVIEKMIEQQQTFHEERKQEFQQLMTAFQQESQHRHAQVMALIASLNQGTKRKINQDSDDE